MSKHKMRWTFEGITESGKVLFPEMSVKPDRRPDFPYMAIADENGGKIVPVPSSISVNVQLSDMKPLNISDGETIQTGYLRLWRQTERIEEWQFTNVGLSIWSDDVRDEDCDMTIKYEAAEYIKLTPTIFPNPEHTASSTALDNSES